MFSVVLLALVALSSCHTSCQYQRRANWRSNRLRSQTNFIKNGDFEHPQVHEWTITDIPGWIGHA